MSSIHEMAYAIYLADCEYEQLGTMPPREWEELFESEQEAYKRHAKAVLKYLLEHGHISSHLATKLGGDA